MTERPNDCPTVSDVRILESRGPWNTKSGGTLNVAVALPLAEVQSRYFRYEPRELERVPLDIRGLRIYTVDNLPKGGIGGNEWHRIREEMVFGIAGSLRWICEDLAGNKKELIINGRMGVWMPPFILHTCEVLEEGSGFLVIANTLFVPDDPTTHDTYSLETFRELQEK